MTSLSPIKTELRNARILLIDEYRLTGDARCTILGMAGAKVTYISELEHASSLARTGEFDLIVIDPKAHALYWAAFANRVRRRNPKQRIVFLSGFGWPLPEQDMGYPIVIDKEAGIHHFIQRLGAVLRSSRRGTGSAASKDKSERTILCIPGLPADSRPWTQLLEERGYRIRECPSSEGALQLAESEEFDCIVIHPLDAVKPAVQLYYGLRYRLSNVPIIFVLRYGMELPAALADVYLVYREGGSEPLIDCIERLSELDQNVPGKRSRRLTLPSW